MHNRSELIDQIKKQLGAAGFRMLDSVAPTIPESGSSVSWQKLGVEGSWDGHHMGPFELNSQMFDQMAQHQRAKKIKTVVDYNHATYNFFSNGEAPASGWVTDIENRKGENGAELFARIEWTPRAAESIRAGEYAYLSPTIVFNTRDRESGRLGGASIHSVALTNTPFLEELPEVRLNSILASLNERGKTAPQEKRNMSIAAIAKMLGLSANADESTVLASVAEQVEDGRALTRICAALGVDPGAEESTVIAQIVQLKASGAESPTALAALRRDAEELRALRADNAVADAERQGKIVGDTHRAWAKDLALSNPAAFAAFVAAAPEVVSLGGNKLKVPPTGGAKQTTLDPFELNLCNQLGLTPEKYLAQKQAEGA